MNAVAGLLAGAIALAVVLATQAAFDGSWVVPLVSGGAGALIGNRFVRREGPRAGDRLAPADRTRRDATRYAAGVVAFIVACGAVGAAFGTGWWLVPVVLLLLGVGSLAAEWHERRWERDRNGWFKVVEMSWWRARRGVWCEAWGERVPAGGVPDADGGGVTTPWMDLWSAKRR